MPAAPSVKAPRPDPPSRPMRSHRVPLLLLALAFALAGIAWFVVADFLPEGPILWTVAAGHGLTVGDLPGIGLILIGVSLTQPRRTLARRRAPG